MEAAFIEDQTVKKEEMMMKEERIRSHRRKGHGRNEEERREKNEKRRGSWSGAMSKRQKTKPPQLHAAKWRCAHVG